MKPPVGSAGVFAGPETAAASALTGAFSLFPPGWSGAGEGSHLLVGQATAEIDSGPDQHTNPRRKPG